MIGNDIIAIAYTRQHTNWRRKGWIEKLFDQQEQDSISKSPDPFSLVWRMWSMKESAYKVHTRSTKKRSFNPSKISCKIIDQTHGLVVLEGKKYATESIINEDYIFSSTVSATNSITSHKVIKILDSRNYYDLILEDVSTQFDWERNEVEIIKSDIGIPKFYLDSKVQNVDLSITHDGKYLAYSFCW